MPKKIKLVLYFDDENVLPFEIEKPVEVIAKYDRDTGLKTFTIKYMKENDLTRATS